MLKESFERDGVAYEIDLVEHLKKYRATWTCPACNESGGILDAFWTPAEAMGRAKANAFTCHHVPVHTLVGPGKAQPISAAL